MLHIPGRPSSPVDNAPLPHTCALSFLPKLFGISSGRAALLIKELEWCLDDGNGTVLQRSTLCQWRLVCSKDGVGNEVPAQLDWLSGTQYFINFIYVKLKMSPKSSNLFFITIESSLELTSIFSGCLGLVAHRWWVSMLDAIVVIFTWWMGLIASRRHVSFVSPHCTRCGRPRRAQSSGRVSVLFSAITFPFRPAMASRRQSRNSLNARQNDPLFEFEACKSFNFYPSRPLVPYNQFCERSQSRSFSSLTNI